MSFLETLGYGGTVAGVGLLVVFVGLILLIAAIMLLSWLLRSFEKKKNKPAAPAAQPVIQVEAVPETAAAAPTADNSEIIAVIMAAIAAMDGGKKQLVVRSVRRVNGWANTARGEQIFKY